MQENSFTSTQAETDIRSRIITEYLEYVKRHGQEPPSIFAFSEQLGIEESEFYRHFNHFDQVSGAFWHELHEDIIGELKQGEEYKDFSAREKLLSYYFSLFSKLQDWRSYVLLSMKDLLNPVHKETRQLKELKSSFKEWVRELVEEGKSKGEIASRASLSNTYPDLFWLQFLFLLNYWIKDRSMGFTSTDAAVEKSVHLSFDLIERNAFDSALDFARFLFQK